MTQVAQKESGAFLKATLLKGSVTASEWLQAFLRDGPKTTSEIKDAVRIAHFMWSTINHAKQELMIRSHYQNGLWIWQIEEES